MTRRNTRIKPFHPFCYAFAIILIGAVGIQSVFAEDWPHWRGPDYNGISQEKGWKAQWPEDGPSIVWKKEIGTGFASIAVSNGKAYTMGNISNKDILYCFDAATGKELWKYSYPCPVYAKNHEGGPCGTPTIDKDRVYVMSKKGDTFCLNAETGKVIWQKDLAKEMALKLPTWYLASSALILDDMAIFNAVSWGIAFNKMDGTLIWKNGNGPAGYATAVPYKNGDKTYIALFGQNAVAGLDPKTGKEIWRYPWQTSYDVNAADPIVAENQVFISSDYGKGCALIKIEGNKAEEVWVNKNMRNHFNSTILWEGNLYGFDQSELKCLDFKTGEVKWRFRGLGKGSLMMADGKMIILSEKGKLVIAKASGEEFEEISSAQVLSGKCWTVPVLANGRIYGRNAAGTLVCVEVK